MDFLAQYFLEPILRNGWFNPLNTAVYGLGLIIGFVLVFKLLKRLRIPINANFFAAILPFILFASSTRALRDFIYKGVVENLSAYPSFFTDAGYHFSVIQQQAYSHIISMVPFPQLAWAYSWMLAYFPTPGSYLITFFLALISLLIGLFIERKSGLLYWKVMAFIGMALCGFNVLIIPFNFLTPLALFLPIIAFWLVLFFGLSRLLRTKYLTRSKGSFLENLKSLFTYQNSGILSAHLFDATATFVALTWFGFGEQHPIPRLFVGALGPVAMFILKIAVLLPILWIIDKETKGGDFRNFLKIGIVVLGLAPGLRDLITLLLV